MATSEQLESFEMRCSVCQECFTQSKILPYAHLLCEKCLPTWLNSHRNTSCLLCHCAIVVADFCFHDNKKGANIVLSNNNKTAERRDVPTFENAIVLSSQPMEVNLLYEVKIEQVKRDGFSMMAGVTAADLASLRLPVFASDLPKDVSVILCNASGHNFVLGTEVPKLEDDIGEKLMTVGSCVGFYVDAARSLHFVVDSFDKGVVCKDMPQPCYAVFGVTRSVIKVKALSPRRMLLPLNYRDLTVPC